MSLAALVEGIAGKAARREGRRWAAHAEGPAVVALVAAAMGQTVTFRDATLVVLARSEEDVTFPSSDRLRGLPEVDGVTCRVKAEPTTMEASVRSSSPFGEARALQIALPWLGMSLARAAWSPERGWLARAQMHVVDAGGGDLGAALASAAAMIPVSGGYAAYVRPLALASLLREAGRGAAVGDRFTPTGPDVQVVADPALGQSPSRGEALLTAPANRVVAVLPSAEVSADDAGTLRVDVRAAFVLADPEAAVRIANEGMWRGED